MNPKISIIVPVYKVEQYLHKCVDSILAQTFKDFELILVDDGSPDNCGNICEDYAKVDKRVKVIHKENGGQASARNFGLDVAKGSYVGFVDSDDWIEPDMYELLFYMCIKNECDIAICTSKIHYTNKIKITGTHPLTILNKYDAMKALFESELFDEVLWTKLFKRELLEDIRLPVGIIYEDTAFTYQVIHKSEKICSIGEPKYNYIIREDSTMDRAKKTISIDNIIIFDNIYKFINKHYQDKKLNNLVTYKIANSSMAVLNLILSSENFIINKEKYYMVSSILNKYFINTIRSEVFPITVKALLTAIKIHPMLYKLLINNLSRGK